MFATTETGGEWAGPRFHTLDAPALAELSRSLGDAYAQLRTPYRPTPEGRVMRPAPGPRAPISANILDAEVDTARIIAPVVSEMSEYLNIDAPAPGVLQGCRWLAAHAFEIAEFLEAGDVMDLEVMEDRCRCIAGLPRRSAEAEIRMAEMSRSIGTQPAFWGSALRVSQVATAAGRRVSDRSVARWADAGEVASRPARGSTSNSVEYLLDDVLDAVDRRRSPENTPAPSVVAEAPAAA